MSTQAEEIKDSTQLWQAIQSAAGVELSEVPILAKYLWFPTPQSGGMAPTLIEMGDKDLPVKPGYIAFAMYQDEEEVRVYALAKTAQDAEGKPNPPTRLTLSKHAALIGVEIMALDVFIDEIADELIVLAGLDADLDDEEEEEEDEEEEEPEDGEPAERVLVAVPSSPNGGSQTSG